MVALTAKNNYNTIQEFKIEEAYVMKKIAKALVVVGLVASMAIGMVGCGSKPVDGSQVVATVGEKEMTLGEANFLLRYQQVQTETYYESMLGEGIYNMDLYGTGSTYGADFKADVMRQMQEYYVIEEKAADYGVALTEEDTAAIAEAAKAFVEANEAATLEQMTADQATVEKVLTLMTLRSKVAAAVKAEADVTVTDEEAAQRGFSYITIAKGSGEEALTEEEIQENKDKLTAVIASVKSGNTIEGAAVEQGLTAYTGNYGEGTDTYYDAELITAMDAIKEGDVTEIVETDAQLYLAQVTAEVDEEATANRKETLLTTAQTEYFNNLLETWVADYPLTVVDSVWEQVVFDRSYEMAQ